MDAKTSGADWAVNAVFGNAKPGGLGWWKLYHMYVGSTYICICGDHFQPSMDQPGMVPNPARGQLNRKNVFFPVHVRA